MSVVTLSLCYTFIKAFEVLNLNGRRVCKGVALSHSN